MKEKIKVRCYNPSPWFMKGEARRGNRLCVTPPFPSPFKRQGEGNRSKAYWIFLGSWLLVLGIFLSGCIRLTGKTGFWYKGKDDEYAKSKQVGFDTQKFTPGYTPGSVQMGES